MGKGIQGIRFLDNPLGSGQIVSLPNLNGCPVYGLMANGLKISLEAEIDTETKEKLTELSNYSQVKWVIGAVNHLGKNGMSWLRTYNDSNGNKRKDANEKWTYDNKGRKIEEISKIDLYNIQDNYEITDKIKIWFPKTEKFKPALYWIEPFLIHPELHHSKEPKGCFLISMDIPQPYEAFISGTNFQRSYIFKELKNVKSSDGLHFYYGDNVELEITTIQVPLTGKLLIEIFNSENKLVSEPEIFVSAENKYIRLFEDTELNIYAQNIYKKAVIDIPLDIKYKPKSQKKKTSDYLQFKITYKPSIPLQESSIQKDYYTIQRDAIPTYSDTDRRRIEDEVNRLNQQNREESKKSESYKSQEKANKFEEKILSGYLAVYFNDTKSYINEREVQVANKMVEVGSELKQAPENDPCHYTKITAERVKDVSIDFTPDVITIFDENTRVESNNEAEIHLISGDNGNSELKLKVDLDTKNNCRIKKHSGGKTVFSLSDEDAKIQRLSNYEIKNDEITLFPRYIYVKDGGNLFPLNYFCLKNVKPITYFIPIETCRYKNIVKVCVYPDIEFSAIAKYNPENSAFVYKTPNFGHRTSRNASYGKRLNSNYQSERKKTYDSSYEFEWAAGYKYNGEEHIYDSEKGIPLLNAICFLMDAYKIAREYLFADEAENAEKRIADNVEQVRVRDDKDPTSRSMSQRYQDRKNKKLPVRITIDRPSFNGGVYGRFSPASTHGKDHLIGYAYSLDFKAEPLFKITGKLDLLFYAQFIPYIGQALKAINKVVDGINFLTLGAVHIDYYLNIAASVAVNLDWTGIERHSIDGWSVSKEITTTININMWVEAGVNLNVNLQGIGTADSEGVMKGEASIDVEISYNKVSDKCDASVNFKGLKVKIWLKFKTEIKRQKDKNPPPEPDTEPDHIKDLIKGMKQPWKINIL